VQGLDFKSPVLFLYPLPEKMLGIEPTVSKYIFGGIINTCGVFII
jgi:hypothetical protein